MDKKEARRMDRFAQYAVAATSLAIKDGNISLDSLNRERIGTIIGSGIGGIESLESEKEKYMEKGPSRVSPLFIPMMISNMAACASATHAIGEAFRMIKYGIQDMVVTGGTEASITPLSLAGFSSMKALSTRNDAPEKASRPFDKERDGFIMGEGSGIIVLEELEHANKRGATIYAEVVGYGATSDAFHITQPDPEANGARNAMRIALEEGNVDYKEVGYINAHGTSTYFNDKL
jgi:3-oxoacyl-[acyl-carrier-protein] synthase II